MVAATAVAAAPAKPLNDELRFPVIPPATDAIFDTAPKPNAFAGLDAKELIAEVNVDCAVLKTDRAPDWKEANSVAYVGLGIVTPPTVVAAFG